MARDLAAVLSGLRTNAATLEQIALAAALGIGGWLVGTAAQKQVPSLRMERISLEAANQQIAQFRAGFRPSDPRETARWQKVRDSLQVIAAKGMRLQMAQSVAKAAEDASLDDVRVTFDQPDSAAVAIGN